MGNERKGLAKLSQHPFLKGIQIHDIPITECQRCPKEIVEAANRLMSKSEAMPLTPANDAPAKIQVVMWKTPVSEAKGMAKLIMNSIKTSDRNHSHLVMVTRRKLGRRLRDELIRLDPSITVELGFSESILELWPVREAFLFFCLLADPDAPTWRAWLGYRTPSETQDHNAPERNADAYLRFLASCHDMITGEAVQQLALEKRSTSRGQGGSALRDRACRYIELYRKRKWRRLTPKNLIAALFDPALWINRQYDDMNTINLDFQLLKNNALQMLQEGELRGKQDNQKERLRQVARQLRYSIATREPLTVTSESTVKVTTLWGAKGLTADHAYVIGLCQEAIPAERSPEYPGNYQDYFEEQRRLFYVTITRSRQTLVLSRPMRIRPGEAKQLNLRVDIPDFQYCNLQICPFLHDIMDDLPDPVDGEELLQSARKKNRSGRNITF